MIKEKKCKKCGELKEIIDFYKDSHSKDKYHSYCKYCKNEIRKKYVSTPRGRNIVNATNTRSYYNCKKSKSNKV